MKKFFIVVALTLLFAIPAEAQNVVHARMSKDTIMIGDQIDMELIVETDIATEINLPSFTDNQIMKGIEVLQMPQRADTLKHEGRRLSLLIKYGITSFDAGTYGLHGMAVGFTNKGKMDTVTTTDTIRLVVNTFEIDTTRQKIADIKPPIETPLQWVEIREIFWISLGGVILLAALIVLVVRLLKKRRQQIKLRPAEPAHVVAIRSLEELHSRQLPERGEYKAYYSDLTDILRTYLDDRYEIWAMEMTTPQIIAALKDVNDEKMITKLGELFSLADLVKFAKWMPTTDECEENFQVAYYYIEETKLNETKPDESIKE